MARKKYELTDEEKKARAEYNRIHRTPQGIERAKEAKRKWAKEHREYLRKYAQEHRDVLRERRKLYRKRFFAKLARLAKGGSENG